MAVTDTLLNTIFDGRYMILRKLGAGGMADVYLAEDQELGRRVAIKILNDRHANDEQFVERFRREAKNAARLRSTSPSTTRGRSSPRSASPTARASSTATSSRTTSSSTARGGSRSPTSASRAPGRAR